MKMENKKAKLINAIEHLLNNEKLSVQQREALAAFDRFNELEAQTSFAT
jgi:hypothetical protein